MKEEDLSRKQVAEILGVSPQTVDIYRQKRLLSAIRYGIKGRWRYKLKDVLRLKTGHD